MNYPGHHLFNSNEWTARTAALDLISPKFTFGRLYGLTLALLRAGIWTDFEEWPSGPVEKVNADWLVYRKLLAEQTTLDQVRELGSTLPFYKKPLVTPYTTSPFLDLTRPLNVKKTAIAHVYRTERKLTREVGAPELREFTTSEERSQWFEWYVQFQREKDRISDEQYEILKKWTLEGEKPEWMRLTGLLVNGVPLAVGLFYYWDGVFYYFSSAMTSDPQYRKYGPGKLFVEKLIQQTIAQGGRIFDFLQGEHEYKAHWNPEIRVLYQCIYPRTVKGFLFLLLFRLKGVLKKKDPAIYGQSTTPWQVRIAPEAQ